MINRKKPQRLYRDEGLPVRRRRGRKRAVGARSPAPVLALTNQRWSLDFVHDQLATGRRFRVLNMMTDPEAASGGSRAVIIRRCHPRVPACRG